MWTQVHEIQHGMTNNGKNGRKKTLLRLDDQNNECLYI